MRHALVVMMLLSFLTCTTGAQERNEFRTWKDASGKYSTEAAFVDFKDGKVRLKKRDGKQLVLELSKFSAIDQAYVKRVTARAAADSGATADWPQWRGPHWNGIAADGQKVPVQWSETSHVIWKAHLPGRGHSSPTVVGDQIVLTTADEREQNQVVLALDRRTGEPRWQTEIHRGGLPAKIHSKNTHATPTVACDGQRLFATFYNGGGIQVVALSLQGKKLWQRTAGRFAPRQYQYGYAPSPLLYKSTVIIAADYDGGGYLTALDKAAGTPKWTTPRPAKLSYSSPVVARVGGRERLLISGCDVVASYDPNTGKAHWATPATTMATCGTMVWDGERVFASGGYPKPETVCLRAQDGRVVWKNNQKCYEQSMLAHNGYVYGITDGGIAYCWRGSDGAEQWRSRLAGGPVSASPILAGGNIFLSNERATTYVFRANPSAFELVGTNQLGNEAFATPVICDNRIYLRVAHHREGRQEVLYCLGLDG